jgi:uroporphyrin-III C-methyltransferase
MDWPMDTQDGATRPAVALVGAGPGDPELLTRRAARRLAEADVVIHDRLASAGVLALARPGARRIEVGKTPYGRSWAQDDIAALTIAEARAGAKVARLKSGDPGVFGRLDEEVAALTAAGLGVEIVPGVTAAAAAAAEIGVSLTRRGRNGAIRLLTAHDAEGFAEQDWRGLARPGAVAAIYMGVRAARWVQGRLMLHGCDPATPATAVENASRPGSKVAAATVGDLPEALARAEIAGPAEIFIGLAPRAAAAAAATLAPAPPARAAGDRL